MRLAMLAAVVLAGCATTPETVWDKPNSSQQEFNVATGQCRAQAFSVPGAPLMQVSIVYASCMQGKGWQQRQK